MPMMAASRMRKTISYHNIKVPSKIKMNERPLPYGKGRFVIYLPSVATATAATAVVTVAVPVQDQEDQDDDPNVTIVENVAEAAHIDFRPFTYLEGEKRRAAFPFC
jgi:hypothetical protein